VKTAFTLNGRDVQTDVPADRRVIDVLREDLGLAGSKEGCGTGECGACAILVDGESRLSCLMLAAQLEGRCVTTIEGVGEAGALHPLQEAFVEHGAVQCGFCTPGMVMSVKELLASNKKPAVEEIKEAVEGNFCRCTGYTQIVEAVLDLTGRSNEKGELKHV